MLKISNLKVILSESKKEILHGINLEINPGKIHLINGNNGSGKSTLVNTIMGNPNFEIKEGTIEILNETYPENIIEKIDADFVKKQNNSYSINLTELEPNERSLAGIYLANQYPVEIPGVSLTSFLRMIYNNTKPKEEQLSIFKFKELLKQKAEIINYPDYLLKRNLNEGFSGGEKKKTEILQMLILEPKYVLLDEIDSGLDRNSVKEVFEGLQKYHANFPQTSFVIISHYDKVIEYLNPDFIHEMSEGEFI